MNIVAHKNKCNVGTLQLHVESPPITLIKSKNDEKSDKDYVDIKLCRYPTSEKLDLCELKMALFYNDEHEEFLFFVCNFNMNIEASVSLKYGTNIKYPRTMVCG